MSRGLAGYEALASFVRLLAQASAQKQRYGEAITELRDAIALSGGNKTFKSTLAYIYAHRVEKTTRQTYSAN